MPATCPSFKAAFQKNMAALNLSAANDSMICTNNTRVALAATRWAGRSGVRIPAMMMAFLQRNPEVIVTSPLRSSYGLLHRAATSKKQAALA